MRRSQKIALVAHCVLNQNSVIQGWARARGAFPEVLRMLIERGIGIIQLPCPEKCFLGLERPPMTVEEYDTEEYRNHCVELLQGLVAEIQNYQRHGVELVGIVSIERSPSCCAQRGIFYQQLLRLLREHGFSVNVQQIPPDFQEGDEDAEFLRDIAKW